MKTKAVEELAGHTNGTGVPSEQIKVSQIVRSPFNRNIETKSANWKDFAGSIRQHGVIQPLLLRPLPAALEMDHKDEDVPRYELVAGERRWLGATEAKLDTVPAIVRVLTDREVIELQTIENDQRQDLSPIEKAEKYQQLLDQYTKDGLSLEKAMAELCAKLNMGKSTVYEALRLLKLPAAAQDAVKEGKLPPSHAGLIAKLEDAPEVQARLVQLVLEKPASEHSWQRTREPGGILSFRDTKEAVDEQVKLTAARKKWEAAAEKHRAKGGMVLEAEDYKKCFGQHGNIKGDYVGGVTSDYSKNWERKTYKELMGRHAPPVVLAHDVEYKVVELYPKKEALAAIEKAGHKKRKAQSGGGYDPQAAAREQEKREALTARMLPVFDAADKQVLASSKKSAARFPWHLVVADLIANKNRESLRCILVDLGWKQKGGGWNAVEHAIIAGASQMPANKVPTLLLRLLLAEREWNSWTGKVGSNYAALLTYYGVSLEKLVKQIAPMEEKRVKDKVQTPGKDDTAKKIDRTDTTTKQTNKGKKKSGLTASARKKLAAAMKARWAARRKK